MKFFFIIGHQRKSPFCTFSCINPEYEKADETLGKEEVLARPAIMPMRAEPKVKPEECLKAYLLKIYTKTVSLYEAEKYLNTFKVQKPKQTCSNFIDEFIIHYVSDFFKITFFQQKKSQSVTSFQSS